MKILKSRVDLINSFNLSEITHLNISDELKHEELILLNKSKIKNSDEKLIIKKDEENEFLFFVVSNLYLKYKKYVVLQNLPIYKKKNLIKNKKKFIFNLSVFSYNFYNKIFLLPKLLNKLAFNYKFEKFSLFKIQNIYNKTIYTNSYWILGYLPLSKVYQFSRTYEALTNKNKKILIKNNQIFNNIFLEYMQNHLYKKKNV